MRAVLQRARDRLGGNGRRTILFIDEIHRFNKGQQDSVLHAVEDGLVTLIGATTENPYFEVNSALLSRCSVIALEPLGDEEMARVVRRGAAALGADVPDDVVAAIAERAGGDARSALSTSSSRRHGPLGRGRPGDPARRGRRPQAPAALRPRR